MASHGSKIKVAASVASVFLGTFALSACSNTSSDAPLVLPTPTFSSSPVTPAPTPSKTTDPAFIKTTTDPNSIQLDGTLASYSADDMKSAYTWVTEFIPSMYNYTGYWTVPFNAATFGPSVYGTYSEWVDKTYWNDNVAPFLISSETFASKADMFKGLGPLPPEIKGIWAQNAVSNYIYKDPTFTEKDGKVIVTVPYTAQAVYSNEAANRFWRVPINHSVSYTLGKTGGDWKIFGWNNTSPTYGKPVALKALPTDRTAITVTGPRPAPSMEQLTQEDIDKINERNNKLNASLSPSPSPTETASPSSTDTP